jgi:hypothetical protein
MKIDKSLTLLTLLLVSALPFCVFVQSQTEQDAGKIRVAPFVIGRGMGPGNVRTTADVVLCNSDGVTMAKSFPSTGKLQIEYKNGSVSQIDLSDVKKMTVSDLPGHQLGD